MISKIFGRNKKEPEQNSELAAIESKIAKMNLSEMTIFVKEKLEDFQVCEEGLVAVMKRLISSINDERYYLNESDDDSKLKKAFDLVVLVAKHKKVTLRAMELMATFQNQYEKLINDYDKKYKEIYSTRLEKAIESAMATVEAKVALQNKMNLLE